MIPPAVQRKVLKGAPGADLDQLVFEAIQGGISVEAAGTGAYRLDGPAEAIDALSMRAAVLGSFFVEIEAPATNSISLSGRLVNARPYTRVTSVLTDRPGIVVRAVDKGLSVAAAGVGRFDITGYSSVQMVWLAESLHKSMAETLADWKVTPADIQQEDEAVRGAGVTVHALLPERVSETQVFTDDEGNLVRSVTTERNAR